MKNYAFAGASIRAIEMYAKPMATSYSDIARLVGVYDVNWKRARILQSDAGGSFPVYEDFTEMLESSKPDIVIVTTIDRYHHEYIIKSLEAGCSVISEKPLTTDAGKCNAILEAEKRTGRMVTVTFNLRFSPLCCRIKELISEGAVGKVLSVNLDWFLDTCHGADYFRRWHRRKENSGGLLVHKATHHFDLINWFLEEDPVTVNAFGSRRFYGPVREQRGERCLTCSYRSKCEFFLDIRTPEFKRIYLDCEDVDGYFRDRCVFSDEIDIEDSMSVNVEYSGGAVMSYSLNAHSPYEGYKLSVNGTGGRLEVDNFDGAVGPFAGEQIRRIRLYNRKDEEISIKPARAEGEHGGGDERLLRMLLNGDEPDPLGRMAGSRAGAMSIAVGIAANESIRLGKSIRVGDLIP